MNDPRFSRNAAANYRGTRLEIPVWRFESFSFDEDPKLYVERLRREARLRTIDTSFTARAIWLLNRSRVDWLTRVALDPRRHAFDRMRAIEQLGELKTPLATSALLAMVDANSWISRVFGERLRKEVVLALGKTGDSRGVKPLIDRMLSDESEAVRWASAAALGQMGDTRAVPALLLARDDPFDGVRQGVAEALGMFPGIGVEHALVEMLANGSSDVRLAAMRSLSALAPHIVDAGPVIAHLEETGIFKPAANSFDDCYGAVRAEAAIFLNRLGDDRAVALLMKLRQKNI